MYWLQAVLDACVFISNVSPSQVNKLRIFIRKASISSDSDNA
jgi:hypothetical protein